MLAASALSVETAAEIIQEFEDELNRIFSVYLDADHGFTEISKMMASLKNPDDYEIRYGTDDDTLSARSMKQIIADNCSDGYNRTFLADACIVIAYQLWDEEYRPRLADAWVFRPVSFAASDSNSIRREQSALSRNPFTHPADLFECAFFARRCAPITCCVLPVVRNRLPFCFSKPSQSCRS